MIAGLAYALVALAGAAAVWGLLTAALDKPPGKAQLLFAAGVWLLTAVQSVLGLVGLATGFRPVDTATTVGYLLAILVLIPLAWFWANSERTRSTLSKKSGEAISQGRERQRSAMRPRSRTTCSTSWSVSNRLTARPA